MKNRLKTTLALMILFMVFAGRIMAEEGSDNRIYAQLLKKHVMHGRVNYDGFKADEAQLDEYLDILNRTRVNTLLENRKFAFYINAYNAFTIKLILTKYPGINSIKEIGSFFSNPWNKKFVLLQGETVSLDYIEHKILRPVFKDPRVHFAINCASKSCPVLRDEPYEGDSLEQQLDDQASRFINDKNNTFIQDNTLYISKIFKWFEADFSGNPWAFVRNYAKGDLKETLDFLGRDIKVSYLDYDWSLNR